MVKPHEAVLVPSGLMNTTDLDSRPMRTHGYKPLQGYNAQLAVNEQQVVIAAELTCDSPDFGHLEPMVRATQRELRGVDLGDPHVVLADAGYWHQRQIETVVSDGIQVLVSPDSSLRRGPRPGWTGGLYDFMRRVLATDDGRALYRQRQATIEPVFGQLKFNRQIRRFQRRGRAACRSRMAAHRRDPQPPQAPPPPDRRDPDLAGRGGAAVARRHRTPAALAHECSPRTFPTASPGRDSTGHAATGASLGGAFGLASAPGWTVGMPRVKSSASRLMSASTARAERRPAIRASAFSSTTALAVSGGTPASSSASFRSLSETNGTPVASCV